MMARKKKRKPAQTGERGKLRTTDIETASEYATIDDLKKKAQVQSESERH